MDHIIEKNGTFKLCGIIRVIDGFVFKLLSACQVAEETKWDCFLFFKIKFWVSSLWLSIDGSTFKSNFKIKIITTFIIIYFNWINLKLRIFYRTIL